MHNDVRKRQKYLHARTHLLRVDGFAFPERVADEHHRLLFQRQVVDPRARRLYPEVVLVLDVDLAVVHASHLALWCISFILEHR